MHGTTPAVLHDIADQLTVLAGTFQTPGNALKAQFIRRAEKSLVTLEAFFNTTTYEQASHWKRAYESVCVLEGRLKLLEGHAEKLALLEEKIKGLQQAMEQWLKLSENERNRIVNQAKILRNFTENNHHKAEAHILNRFQRYDALRPLLAYSDKADHLCDAVFHYENRERYEESLVRLQKKKDHALERLASVKRGFYLAMGLCVLLVTIPLCVPFAFSLWSRRREIENQIANIDEMSRCEEKRLTAADEGVVASQEIRDILGNVSLDQVRRILSEARELRAEFQRPEQSTSVTAGFLSFLDLYRVRLEELFGEIPEEPETTFTWYLSKVNELLNIESELESLNETKHKHLVQVKKITRGHSIAILKDSITKLRHVVDTTFDIQMSKDLKAQMAQLCVEMPDLLSQTRQALSLISHGQRIYENYWAYLHIRLKSSSNMLNACIVDHNIQRVWSSLETAPVRLISVASV